MSKYDGPHDGGFKNARFAKEHAESVALVATCAKMGIEPPAMHFNSREDAHESRKAARRLINALGAQVAASEWTPEQGEALDACGRIVAKANIFLGEGDGTAPLKAAQGTDWRDASGRAIKMLRTVDDFRAHYRGGPDDLSLGDFFRGVAGLQTSQGVKNALTEGTDSQGGYTVPAVVMPQILQALVPNSSLLQAGMPIVPLDQGGKTFTTAVISTVPNAAWRSENGALAESDPVFAGVVATPRSLSFFFKISRELLADSPNIEGALLTAIGQAMAKAIDLAGLRGSGSAPTPRGILNTSGIQPVPNGTNGAALTSYANIFSALSALLAADAPMPNAAIMAPRSLVKLGGLTDSTGQPVRVPPMLEGVKMLTTSQIPLNLTVGTSTDCSEIYVGDFHKIALMLREGLSVQIIKELYAGTGQLAFACHVRADFAVMYPSAFAVVTGVRP